MIRPLILTIYLILITSAAYPEINVVKIERFCNNINYNPIPEFSINQCYLINYYNMHTYLNNKTHIGDICVYVDKIENFYSLETIVKDCYIANISKVFVYQFYLENGYWQMMYTGQEEFCVPVYETNLNNLTYFDNMYINFIIDNIQLNDSIYNNTVKVNLYKNDWITELYDNGHLYIFIVIAFLIHFAGLLDALYHIYLVSSQEKKSIVFIIVLSMSAFGSLLLVLYMIIDPMNYCHRVSITIIAFFGSFALPWNVLISMFVAFHYYQLLEDLYLPQSKIQKIILIIVCSLVFILFIPRIIKIYAEAIFNYSLSKYINYFDLILFMFMTLISAIIYTIAIWRISNYLKKIRMSRQSTKKNHEANHFKIYIIRTFLMISATGLNVFCLVMSNIIWISNYPLQRTYIFAIGWAVCINYLKFCCIRALNIPRKTPESNTKRTSKQST